MFRLNADALQFTPAKRQTLIALGSGEPPGSILHDFGVMLDYLQATPAVLTAGLQLPLTAVTDINARMTRPLQTGLQRALQKSYPHVQALYLLLRASGLSSVAYSGKKAKLTIDPTALQHWNSLNPIERYGNLLETWIFHGNPEIIGEREGFDWLIRNSERLSTFSTQLPKDGLAVAGQRDVEDSLKYYPGWYRLALMELFGMVDIEPAPVTAGKAWAIERIRPTPAGEALVAVLHSEILANLDFILGLDDAEDEPVKAGVLRKLLRPFWSGWKRGLWQPKWAFQEGAYTFKVALGPQLWRRVEIGAKQPLDALAWVILEAFEFDDDHLYEFSYRNQAGGTTRVKHPYMEESPSTQKMRVGDVPLPVGQSMVFLFDFGDNWEFAVTLEKIDAGRKLKQAAVLEAQGDAPEQYPNWEEDDWDDEFDEDEDEEAPDSTE